MNKDFEDWASDTANELLRGQRDSVLPLWFSKLERDIILELAFVRIFELERRVKDLEGKQAP